MNFRDIFSLAFRTVRSNKLRTGLTVAIIAFGIMALIGIITAIKAMNQKFTESFSTMGANAFTIRYKERNINFGGSNKKDITVSRGVRFRSNPDASSVHFSTCFRTQPDNGKDDEWYCKEDDDIDEAQVMKWVKQASKLPGEKL